MKRYRVVLLIVLAILMAVVSPACKVKGDYVYVVPDTTEPATEVEEERETVTETSVTNCQGWAEKEVKFLNPGQSALGDVVVSWPGADIVMQAFDAGGEGEGTIVVNNSTSPVSIRAPYGAGCKNSVDIDALVEDELTEGCGDEVNGCKTIRLVILDNNGTAVQFRNDPQ